MPSRMASYHLIWEKGRFRHHLIWKKGEGEEEGEEGREEDGDLGDEGRGNHPPLHLTYAPPPSGAYTRERRLLDT